jgi:tRNA G10  N-methylase Trm11
VTDAPYGVAHGSHAGGSLARNPLALLRAALPVWTRLLRPGGALGLAWNTHVAPRETVAGVLAENGLRVLGGPGYDALAHRVDQAIHRDVIVARN